MPEFSACALVVGVGVGSYWVSWSYFSMIVMIIFEKENTDCKCWSK